MLWSFIYLFGVQILVIFYLVDQQDTRSVSHIRIKANLYGFIVMMNQQQVGALLKEKQKEMAFQMDTYYRKRMAEMLTSQKEAQEIEIKQLQVELTKSKNQFQDITTIAEEGYQELYTDIHRQHDDTISTLKSELSTALKDNALLREK